jgi:hypothetical protein
MWIEYRDKYRRPEHEKPTKKKSKFGFKKAPVRKET